VQRRRGAYDEKESEEISFDPEKAFEGDHHIGRD
jgi:hypothetical protein